MKHPDCVTALIRDFAHACGLDTLHPAEDGGFHIVVGRGVGVEISLYGGDQDTLLLISSVALLPLRPDLRLLRRLLRSNLYDSILAPFQVALDDEGALVFWGRLSAGDFDSEMLTGLVEAVAGRVQELRAEVEATESVG